MDRCLYNSVTLWPIKCGRNCFVPVLKNRASLFLQELVSFLGIAANLYRRGGNGFQSSHFTKRNTPFSGSTFLEFEKINFELRAPFIWKNLAGELDGRADWKLMKVKSLRERPSQNSFK